MNKVMLVSIFTLSLCAAAFAQSNYSDSVTITTYYPSPYGSYGSLEVRKSLAVGDVSKAGIPGVTRTDHLGRGQLYIENSTIFHPRAGDPATWPINRPEGEIVYSAVKKDLYFFNGASWNPVGKTNIAATPPPTQPPIKTIVATGDSPGSGRNGVWIDLSAYKFTSPPTVTLTNQQGVCYGSHTYQCSNVQRFSDVTKDGFRLYSYCYCCSYSSCSFWACDLPNYVTVCGTTYAPRTILWTAVGQ